MVNYPSVLFPDTHHLLGRRLVDYTLGHALLLERVRSPFVIPRKEVPTRWDVKLFGALCSRPFPDARRLVQSKWLRWVLRFFPCSGRDMPRAIHQIFAYLRHSSRAPARWQKDGGKSLGTPVLQQLKLTMMWSLGKTEIAALCTPLALAFHDCLSVWEMEGGLELADTDMDFGEGGHEELLKRLRADNLPPQVLEEMEKCIAKFKERAEREDEFGA